MSSVTCHCLVTAGTRRNTVHAVGPRDTRCDGLRWDTERLSRAGGAAQPGPARRARSRPACPPQRQPVAREPQRERPESPRCGSGADSSRLALREPERRSGRKRQGSGLAVLCRMAGLPASLWGAVDGLLAAGRHSLAPAGDVGGEVGRQDSDRVANADVCNLAALDHSVDGGRADAQPGRHLADGEQVIDAPAKGSEDCWGARRPCPGECERLLASLCRICANRG
jgi:hypothetical protein